MAAEQVVVELTVDAKGATAGVAQFNTVLDRAHAKAEQVRDASMQMLSGVPQSADRVSTALKRLQASFDPVSKAQFAMEREMTRSMALIERGIKLGVTNEQQAANIISGIRQKQVRELEAVRNAQLSATAAASTRGRPLAANTNFNTANIAAQFQDIAVTSAMGMSPIQIALQQGTQLSAAFGSAGAAGSVRMLGAALTSLVSPVSLITLGLTAAAALAIQYFTNWSSASQDSEESLKKQADLIKGVASKWGEALPALKAYNDEIQRTQDMQAAIEAAAAAGSQQYTGARSSIGDVNVDITDLILRLQDMNADSGAISELQHAFSDLQEKIQDSTAAGDDARRVQGEIADLAISTGIPTIIEYAAQFQDLAKRLDEASEKAAKYREEAALLAAQQKLNPLNPLDGFNRTPFQTEEQIQFDRQERERKQREAEEGGIGIPIPTPRPNDIERLDMQPEGPSGKSYLQTQQERIENLRLEMHLIGESDAVRAKMIAQLQAEQQIRQLGIDQHGAEANAIRANSAEITNYSQQLQDLAEAQAGVNERAQFFGDLTLGVFDDLASGADGLEKALKRIVNSLADAVLQAVLLGQGPLAGLFGTAPSGGASVGGLFGDLFGGGSKGSPAAPFGAPDAFMKIVGGFGRVPDNVGAGVSASMAGGGGVQAQVWNYFAGKGLAPHQIAGIMGNFGAESGFNPSAVNRGSGAYGIGQWLGSRKIALGSGAGLDRQLAHTWNELQGPESRVLSNLRASTDVRGATSAFAGFERAEGWSNSNPEGIALFSKRLDGANDAFAKFGTTTSTVTQDLGSLGRVGADATAGLGDFGNSLKDLSNVFPAAPGGGGGGGGGWLSNLFGGGGGGSLLSSFSPFTQDWISNNVGLFHDGGIAGFATQHRNVDPRVFIGAPRYHSGGIAGDEVPSILRRGEIVSRDMKHLRQQAGGGSVNVVFNDFSTGKKTVQREERKGPDGSTEVILTLRDMIGSELAREGSPANKAMRKVFGAQPVMRDRS